VKRGDVVMEFGKFRLPKAELQPIYRKIGDTYIEISDRRAIVSEDGTVYDIVSDKYKLIQHEQVKEIVDRIIEEMKLPSAIKIPKISYNGATFFYNVIIDRKAIENDWLDVGFRVTNSYDRSLGVNVTGYIVRLACTNGLVVAEKLFGRKIKHMRPLVELDYKLLKEAIETVIENIMKVLDVIEMAKKKTVSVWEIVHFIETEFKNMPKARRILYMRLRRIVGDEIDNVVKAYQLMKKLKKKEEREQLMERYNIPVNLWESINVITEYTTHQLERRNPQIAHSISKKASELLLLAKGV